MLWISSDRDDLDRSIVPSDDQVSVIVADAGSVDVVSRFGGGLRKAGGDGLTMLIVESDGRVFQCVLSAESERSVMRVVGIVMFVVYFRGLAEFYEFPRTNEIRPRAPRIIRKPETISTDDEMAPTDHE